MKTTLVFAVLLASVLVSCDSANDTPDTPADPLMPLKVGNSWVYQIEHFDYYDGTLDTSYIDTLRLTSVKTVGSDQFYSVRISGFDLEDSAYYFNRADGFWLLQGSTQQHIAKYPASVGDSFAPDTNFAGSYAWAVGKWVLVAKDELVSVPAGIFNCYKYQFDYIIDSTDELYSREINWIAPGTGFVKNEKYYNDKLSTGGFRYHKVGQQVLLSKDLK